MAFFRPEKLSPRKIEIDADGVSAESPAIERRLARIEANYEQLDSVLADLESKLDADERLQAIEDINLDFEATFGIKRKRKWRPAKPKKRSPHRSPAARKQNPSAGPRKPR